VLQLNQKHGKLKFGDFGDDGLDAETETWSVAAGRPLLFSQKRPYIPPAVQRTNHRLGMVIKESGRRHHRRAVLKKLVF
jgi:hypothetical protein